MCNAGETYLADLRHTFKSSRIIPARYSDNFEIFIDIDYQSDKYLELINAFKSKSSKKKGVMKIENEIPEKREEVKNDSQNKKQLQEIKPHEPTKITKSQVTAEIKPIKMNIEIPKPQIEVKPEENNSNEANISNSTVVETHTEKKQETENPSPNPKKPWSPKRDSIVPLQNEQELKNITDDLISYDLDAPKIVQQRQVKSIPIEIGTFTKQISLESTISFTIEVSDQKKYIQYNLVDEISKNIVLFAKRDSSISGCNYLIYSIENVQTPIAQISSNFTRSSFVTTTMQNGELREICALDFKSSFKNVKPTKQFLAVIPEYRDDIPSGYSLLKNDNLVIKMMPKPPKMKGGIPVLRFGGRVKMESVKNHILVKPDDTDTNILIFGKVTESTYAGDAYYPLTPLQAFCLCLPHFK
ncbi:hypothetical protein TVAG_333930 [Trichomonas vaginalis G3]|uniref:Tubby C-terminal domain-containing protein n=1 Tax=Trichomonas vaginalis (strain ATCC PRA-98 / G3) TaxID=412133 RepID=A2EI99_TRIV3|nr:phosphatidylinositol binding [Trichomonas vaginalis G3]EAY07581.1 hypothetical protein TVAG_333930 [Trichomonas vaginalis G3]KAI5541945.1 phosphatidylinositol binding [Trichomonas vaginalis G3]|eukprot:XP_001319804.1 hypothetical protein [Trichomonas vaginalis G3]